MNAWLDDFEEGLFRKTAEEINAPDPLADVRRCFGKNGDGAWLWHRETGENEIRALLRDYRIVAESSKRGFVTPVNSVWECIEAWRDKTRNIRIPCATLVALKPQSKTFLGLLKEIAGGGHLEQNDRRDAFFREITDKGDINRDMLDGCLALFKSTYSEQLSGLDTQEMDDLYLTGLDKSSFLADKPAYEQMLVQKVSEIKSHQGRVKLLALWEEKTGTPTPSAWSKQFETPILAMVPPEGTPLLNSLRNALNALNNKESSVANVEAALDFFSIHPEVFSWFDGKVADEAFQRSVLGRYAVVLTDLAAVRTRLGKLNAEAVFNGDPEHHLPGHISLSIPGISGEALMHVLDLKGIAVSTGAACDSRSTKISDVLKAIGLPMKLAKGTIRITLGADNTADQVQYIADNIVEYCKIALTKITYG